jgi:O-antigen/teichoic acid export membrane protein
MNGLLALGHNPLRSRILVFNALFSISLYLLLIPTYSWRGAIIGTIISEVVAIALAWVFLVSKQRLADRTTPMSDPDILLHEEALEAVEEITAAEAPL